MLKAALRKVYKSKRDTLSPGQVASLSHQIAIMFFETFELSNIHSVHCFLPITNKIEVDTWPIIRKVQSEFPHIVILAPKCLSDGCTMQSYPLTPDTSLTESALGITEPLEGEAFDPEKIDLIVLPLLAFDQAGHRVGYGKGFYDRFLESCRSDVLKVGVSFFDAELKIDDANEYDVALNYCITPNQLYKF